MVNAQRSTVTVRRVNSGAGPHGSPGRVAVATTGPRTTIVTRPNAAGVTPSLEESQPLYPEITTGVKRAAEEPQLVSTIIRRSPAGAGPAISYSRSIDQPVSTGVSAVTRSVQPQSGRSELAARGSSITVGPGTYAATTTTSYAPQHLPSTASYPRTGDSLLKSKEDIRSGVSPGDARTTHVTTTSYTPLEGTWRDAAPAARVGYTLGDGGGSRTQLGVDGRRTTTTTTTTAYAAAGDALSSSRTGTVLTRSGGSDSGLATVTRTAPGPGLGQPSVYSTITSFALAPTNTTTTTTRPTTLTVPGAAAAAPISPGVTYRLIRKQ
mmetsp:Transcript_30634/g.67273  ORF Transcript_30634/g.67273 Transcript_30634/m.67273 type:complete len:323 (+) Transcript_30634:3-971(+)